MREVPLNLFNSGRQEDAGKKRTGGAVTDLPSHEPGGESGTTFYIQISCLISC